MKVLLFADSHGSKAAMKKLKAKAKKAGLVLCLGDFTIFGSDQKKVLKEINNLGPLCLLIHGNHEHAADVRQDCKGLKNIVFVDKKVLRIGHLIFMGYGGGGFSLRDKDFEKVFAPRFISSIKDYKGKIGKSGKDPKTVLLLHGPPYGSKVDDLGDHHCGNKSFRDFYKKQKIDYVFCGHIHEASGTVEHIKKTTLINPGPTGMLLDL